MPLQKLWAPLTHSPKLVAFADAQFGLGRDVQRDQLLTYVDDSDFSLLDWMEALKLLGHWLDAHDQSMELEDQLGYVSCAVEAAGADARMEHLPSLVSDMLHRYGCERAQGKSLESQL